MEDQAKGKNPCLNYVIRSKTPALFSSIAFSQSFGYALVQALNLSILPWGSLALMETQTINAQKEGNRPFC